MPKNQAEYDKLFKIRSLIDLPKESVMRKYEPSSCMAIDEIRKIDMYIEKDDTADK